METKTIDVNISNVLSGKRQIASFAGALLGRAFAEVELKDIWPGGKEGFENDKKSAATPGTALLMTNRSPRKYSIRTKNILGANFDTVGVGDAKQVGIAINSRPDGTRDLFLSLTDGVNPVISEKPLADAIDAALRGEGENFFLDVENVVKLMNDANKAEIKNIDTLILGLNKMKQNIQGAIIENEKKAAEITREWNESKVDNLTIKDVLGGAQGVINIHTAAAE